MESVQVERLAPLPQQRRQFLTAAMVSLAVIMLIVFVATTQSASLGTLSGLAFLTCALFVVARSLLNPGLFTASPVSFAIISYVMFVGVGPLLAPLVERRDVIDPSAFSLLIAWAGFGAMLAGYASFPMRGRKLRASSSRGLLLGAIFFTIVGSVGLIAYIVSVGGIGYFFTNAYAAKENSSVYSGFFSMLRPGFYFLLAWILTRERQSKMLWAVLVAYLIVNALWFGPLGGARHYTITFAVTLVCLTSVLAKTGHATIWVAVIRRFLVPAMITVILIWGTVRIYTFEQIAYGETEDFRLSEETQVAIALGLYAPYDTYSRIVDSVPFPIPYQFGRSLYETATVPIPRGLWPDKPVSYGVWLNETLYDRYTGNSVPTWPGELYINFGVIGVLIGMALVGATCAYYKGILEKASKSGSLSGLLIYSVMFSLSLDWIWGGSNAFIWYLMLNAWPIQLWTIGATMVSGTRKR